MSPLPTVIRAVRPLPPFLSYATAICTSAQTNLLPALASPLILSSTALKVTHRSFDTLRVFSEINNIPFHFASLVRRILLLNHFILADVADVRASSSVYSPPLTIHHHRSSNEYAHLTNIKAVKYSRIFTSIKTGFEYYYGRPM